MNNASGNDDEASINAEGRTAWCKSMSIAYEHQDWGPLMDHLQNNPEDAKVAEVEFGWRPLHWACQLKAPLEVIQGLLNIYPEAASAKSKTGFSPIYHLLNGLDGSPSIDSVKLMIEANHDALGNRITRADGATVLLPVYRAFLFDLNTPEVFELVLRSTPERDHAVFVRWACKRAKINHNENMKVILNCVDSKVLRIADNRGRLPLHLACNNTNLSDDFVLALHDKYPDAAHVRDNSGKYPNIHSRVKSKLANQNCRLATYNQKVEGLTLATVMSDAARRREESELDATKSALANEKKRNRQLEQELRQLKKLRRAKN